MDEVVAKLKREYEVEFIDCFHPMSEINVPYSERNVCYDAGRVRTVELWRQGSDDRVTLDVFDELGTPILGQTILDWMRGHLSNWFSASSVDRQ